MSVTTVGMGEQTTAGRRACLHPSLVLRELAQQAKVQPSLRERHRLTSLSAVDPFSHATHAKRRLLGRMKANSVPKSLGTRSLKA